MYKNIITNYIPIINLPLIIFKNNFFNFYLTNSISSLSPKYIPEKKTYNKSNYNPQKQKKQKKYSITNT